MKKRSNRIQIGYGFFLVLLATCMLFLGVFIGSHKLAEVEAKDNFTDREKYYTTLLVEEGDTLWDIADEYMTEEYEDKEAFIREVSAMNQLTGHIIRCGDTIIIPYYADAR